jgi:large subunit ribosomal protein L18
MIAWQYQVILIKTTMKTSVKTSRRQNIRYRIRAKISGTAQKPRLSVFRSNADIYCQLIDDVNGVTLSAASSREKDIQAQAGTKIEKSKLVGQSLARKAKELGVEKVVFDRGGNLYHGRVKAVADGAREGGLVF